MLHIVYGCIILSYLYRYLKDIIMNNDVDIYEIYPEFSIDIHTPDSDLVYVTSIQELKNISYNDFYLSKDIIFQGITYTLERIGQKQDFCLGIENECHISNRFYDIHPLWSLQLKDVTLTITNII